MKFNHFFIFLILIVIVVFASGCGSGTSKPSSSPSSQSSSVSGSTALPAWVSGQIAQLQLTIPNGKPPYQCSLKQGSSLPDGFTLSNDCKLAGAPILAAGSTRSITPAFSVIITDSSNPPRTEELPLIVTIVQSVPRLIPVAGGVCTVNKECTVEVAQADGGTPPYHFQSDTFANGAPPMGMIVDLNGYLTGTPSKAGTYNFGVCVVDVVGASKCGQAQVVVEDEEIVEESGGLCSSNVQCTGFAQRNCDAPENVRCGGDGLCHCCLTLCPGGTNCRCIDCSTGCGGGTSCMDNACAFDVGGSVTE